MLGEKMFLEVFLSQPRLHPITISALKILETSPLRFSHVVNQLADEVACLVSLSLNLLLLEI